MIRTAGIGTRAFICAAVLACVATLADVSPAAAAGPWFVAVGGNNAASCTSAASPCATIIGALSKAGFVNGDTINVAAGTYTAATVAQLSIVGSKGANIVGQGAGAVLDGNNLGSAFANAGAVTTRLTNLTLRNGSNNTSFGGGLRVQVGTVITQDVNIASNKSTLGGGAIVYPNATLTMNGGAVSSNTSTAVANQRGYGGAIYNFANGTLNVTGTTFTGNVADGSTFALAGLGGGIMNSGTATISGATFTGNRATGTGLLDGLGGGVYNTGALTVNNTTISGGSVSPNAILGGGIVSSAFTATGLTVTGNTASVGGGIYVNGNSTLTNSTITKNKATQASTGVGGGIDAVRPTATTTATLVLNGTDVTENTSAAYGGGIAAGAGITTQIKGGSTVARNVAPVGAGISNAGELTVTDSHLDHNDASYGAGALYLGSTEAADRPKATITDSTVDQNTAAAYGGGGWVHTSAALTTDGAKVRGNTAIGGGGLIVGDGGTVKATNTDFIDNTASNFGGGALFSAGAVELTDSTLRGNHAVHTTGTTGVGGAIYSGSNTANAATSLKITGSTISENDAYAASALVVASNASGVTNKTSITNSTITGNSTTSQVGAIQQYHPMSIVGSTITNNTSGSNSGAFYALDPAKLSISGSIVAGNSGNECSLAGSSVADGGYNISSDATCGFTAAKHDIIGDPQLGTLGDNGGLTATQLPGPASKALDQIPSGTGTGQSDAVSGNALTLCVGTDQRGKARPQGAKCDMGSVEADQTTPTIDGPEDFDIALNVDMGSVTYTSTGSPQAALSVDGDLPAGVSFTDNGDGTGKFTGTPTDGPGGEYNVTVEATNEAGTGTKSVTIKLHEAPTLSGPSGNTYTVGEPGGPDLFEQTGGYPDANLSADGDLPDGVTFTPQSGGKGELGGTPQDGAGGHYPITIEGDNGTPPVAKWPFSLTVNEAASLDGPSSASFTVGDAGSSSPFTAGGYPKPDLSATGLPAGLSISGTGEASITGTPHDSTGGEYSATVRASNGIGSDATKNVDLTVKEAPELDGPDEVRFVENRDDEAVYSSDGYPTATLTVSGNLPDGITFTDHGNGSATLGGNATTAAVGSPGTELEFAL